MKQYSYVRNGCEAIDLRLLSAANFNRKEQNELQREGERREERKLFHQMRDLR